MRLIARSNIADSGFPAKTALTPVAASSAAKIEPDPGTNPSGVGKVRSGFVPIKGEPLRIKRVACRSFS